MEDRGWRFVACCAADEYYDDPNQVEFRQDFRGPPPGFDEDQRFFDDPEPMYPEPLMPGGVMRPPCNWFYINCFLHPEDSEEHRRHVSRKVGARRGGIFGRMFHTMSDEPIVGEMQDTLLYVVRRCLMMRRFQAEVTPIPLPPLAVGMMEGTLPSGEVVLVFKVTVHDMVDHIARRNTPGYGGGFCSCCHSEERLNDDRLIALHVDSGKLAKTLPSEIMVVLQREFDIYVKVEGGHAYDQAEHLLQHGWPPSAWAAAAGEPGASGAMPMVPTMAPAPPLPVATPTSPLVGSNAGGISPPYSNRGFEGQRQYSPREGNSLAASRRDVRMLPDEGQRVTGAPDRNVERLAEDNLAAYRRGERGAGPGDGYRQQPGQTIQSESDGVAKPGLIGSFQSWFRGS